MTRIKDLRRERGETQENMAALIGITRGAYANIENGKREPDIKTMTVLANHFGVTIDCLMGLEQKKEPPAQGGELSIDELLDKMSADELFDVLEKASKRLREKNG